MASGCTTIGLFGDCCESFKYTMIHCAFGADPFKKEREQEKAEELAKSNKAAGNAENPDDLLIKTPNQ